MELKPQLDYEPSTRRGLWRDLFIGSIISWSILSTIGFAVVVMWVVSTRSAIERGVLVVFAMGGATGVISTIYGSTADAECRSSVLRGTLIGIAIGGVVVGSICAMLVRAV